MRKERDGTYTDNARTRSSKFSSPLILGIAGRGVVIERIFGEDCGGDGVA